MVGAFVAKHFCLLHFFPCCLSSADDYLLSDVTAPKSDVMAVSTATKLNERQIGNQVGWGETNSGKAFVLSPPIKIDGLLPLLFGEWNLVL